MKKIASILLVFVISITLLLGCSDNSNNSSTDKSVSYNDPLPDYDHTSIITPNTNENSDMSKDFSNDVITENSFTSSIIDDNSNNTPLDDTSNIYSQKGFIVKSKKYDYKGNNVVLLYVENQTNINYTITIKGSYLDESNNVIKQEIKTFEGFAANFKNHFVFKPNITFNDFSYELEFNVYHQTAFSQYMITNNTVNVGLEREHRRIDNNSEKWDDYVSIYGSFQWANLYDKTLCVAADFILFDKNGEIYFIDDQLLESTISPITPGKGPADYAISRIMCSTNHPWSQKDSYIWPEELNSKQTGQTTSDELIGVIAFKAISDTTLIAH